MSAVLTPDGQPNWEQVDKQRWQLKLGDDVLSIYVGSDFANLYRNQRFVKRFHGDDAVEQLNVNVLRQIERHG